MRGARDLAAPRDQRDGAPEPQRQLGVIGSTLARPRMPSVPKSFRSLMMMLGVSWPS
jgi:hypothetical protein